MKKKFLTALVMLICFVLPCSILLTACGEKDKNGEGGGQAQTVISVQFKTGDTTIELTDNWAKCFETTETVKVSPSMKVIDDAKLVVSGTDFSLLRLKVKVVVKDSNDQNIDLTQDVVLESIGGVGAPADLTLSNQTRNYASALANLKPQDETSATYAEDLAEYEAKALAWNKFLFKSMTDELDVNASEWKNVDGWLYYSSVIPKEESTIDLVDEVCLSEFFTEEISSWSVELGIQVETAKATAVQAKTHAWHDDVAKIDTITSTWPKMNQKVIFNTMGGEEIDPLTVESGSNLLDNLPETATRPGYDFKGWFHDEACTMNVWSSDEMPFYDITVYAKWEKCRYTITAVLGNGDEVGQNGSTSAIVLTGNNLVSDKLLIPKNAEKQGEFGTFMGWYTKPEGEGGALLLYNTQYLARSVEGYTDSDGRWIHVGNVTVYPHYGILLEDVAYGDYEGHEELEQFTGTFGNGETITFDYNLTRDGSDFDAYYLVKKNYDAVTVKTTIEYLEKFENSITVEQYKEKLKEHGLTADDDFGIVKKWNDIFEVSQVWDNSQKKYVNKVTGLTDYGNTLTEIVCPSSFSVFNVFLGNSAVESLVFPENATAVISGVPTRLVTLVLPTNYNITVYTASYVLKSITFTGASAIADNQFENLTSLETVVAPKGLSSIGKSAFKGCTALKSFDCSQVETIGDSAFEGCTSLESFTIPSTLTKIGTSAFKNCSALSELNFNAINCSDLTYTDAVFYGAGSSELTLTIANGVKSIPAYLFYVGDEEESPKIKKVTIPSSVTKVGIGAFSKILALEEFNVLPTSLKDWGRCVVQMSGSSDGFVVTLAEGTETIPGSFANESNISSINFPSSLKVIGDYAFYNCGKLTFTTLSFNGETIGDYAFNGCSGLTTVSVNATTIGDYAFRYCSGLTTVSVNATTIGDYAFNQCSELTTATIGATTIGDSAFSKCFKLKTLTLQSGIETIDESAFANCTLLTGDLVLDSVKTIGKDAFYNTSFTSVSFGPNLETIGEGAFSLNNLTSVSLGSNLESIGESAFLSNKLTSISFGSNLKTIGQSAFYNNLLESITWSDGLLSIGEYAFYNNKLTSLIIPDSVTTVGKSAFDSNSDLTYVVTSKGMTGIPYSCFSSCPKLETIVVRKGITSISGIDNVNNKIEIYYESNQEDWDKVSMGESTKNSILTVYYYHDHSQEDCDIDTNNIWKWENEDSNVIVSSKDANWIIDGELKSSTSMHTTCPICSKEVSRTILPLLVDDRKVDEEVKWTYGEVLSDSGEKTGQFYTEIKKPENPSETSVTSTIKFTAHFDMKFKLDSYVREKLVYDKRQVNEYGVYVEIYKEGTLVAQYGDGNNGSGTGSLEIDLKAGETVTFTLNIKHGAYSSGAVVNYYLEDYRAYLVWSFEKVESES